MAWSPDQSPLQFLMLLLLVTVVWFCLPAYRWAMIFCLVFFNCYRLVSDCFGPKRIDYYRKHRIPMKYLRAAAAGLSLVWRPQTLPLPASEAKASL